MKTLVLLLFLMTTCQKAQANVPLEAVIPDWKEYTITQDILCVPPTYHETVNCVVGNKDSREVLFIVSRSREFIEVREKGKRIWHKDWVLV